MSQLSTLEASLARHQRQAREREHHISDLEHVVDDIFRRRSVRLYRRLRALIPFGRT
jgi:hypothetical protein